jgi:type II secretory pathway component GspD/PulD (secretin)
MCNMSGTSQNNSKCIGRPPVVGVAVAPRRRRRLAVALAALIAAGMTGCAQKARPNAGAERVIARQEGEINPPLVISNSPERDTRAMEIADERLSETDWMQLEKLGPRPIWQQLAVKKQNCPPKSRKARRGNVIEARSSDTDGADPATQPSTQPSTGPVTRAMGSMPDTEMPVEIVELPDGKLRMVWVLQSYGGTTIKSDRNKGTTRRDVEVVAPDLTPLVAVLTQNLGTGGTVVPLPKENTLVITCGKEMKTSVLDLLATLDVPAKQVQITAKIFEVSRDFDFQQGTELVLNRLASDSSQQLVSTFSAKRFLDSVGGAAPAQGSVLKLMQAFSDAGVSVDASFQMLADAGMINVVSSPRMTVAVGQTGYMLAGQELPIQSANIVNNVLQTATSYKPVGVQLYVTPQAVGPSRVKLHTISIVSSVSGFSSLPTLQAGNSPRNLINPIIESREAETAVTVDDGSTLVISGLRMIRTTTRESKIPGLGDVPILGWMFKNHRTQQQQTDLYFFLTPTLL